MNKTTYQAGVASRVAINNGVTNAVDTAKAGGIAVLSFLSGLIRGDAQPAPTTKRTARKAVKPTTRRATR